MGIPIEKSFIVKAPAGEVWDFLTDPKRVASCLPGAAITEKIDDQTYAGTIAVKVGPVLANYRGKMRFERLDPAAREAEIAASGQETRGKGGADMRMKSRIVESAPGESEVTVTSDVNVVGVLAQFGRGMIQDVSDLMFQKFTDAMRRQLETPAGAGAGSDDGGGSPAGSGTAGTESPASIAAVPPSAGASHIAPAAADPEPPGAAQDSAPPAAPNLGAPAAPPTPEAAPAPAAAVPQPIPAPPAAQSSPAAAAPAISAPPPATPTAAAPRPSSPPAAPQPEYLDVGAIGATAARRAAGRTLRRPAFWIALAALAAIVYWFLR